MLPVPMLLGDRQPNGHLLPAWAPLDELARYLKEGRTRDAWIILEHAGTSLPIEEVPGVVQACRRSGLQEAADTVLHYAGLRNKEAVLRLLKMLLLERRSHDVKLLLREAIGDDDS
jgi:hypothetical protein